MQNCSQPIPMDTPKRLNNKVAIVTAATAGIGKAIAERLAQEGASVMICSRHVALLNLSVPFAEPCMSESSLYCKGVVYRARVPQSLMHIAYIAYIY